MATNEAERDALLEEVDRLAEQDIRTRRVFGEPMGGTTKGAMDP